MPTLDLDAICKPPPTHVHTHDPQPIYRFDDYIALYERHCRQQGLPFDATRFDPKVYKYEPPAPTVKSEEFRCGLFGDRMRVRFEVDEETESIRLIVDTILLDLHSKYWQKGEQPPLNELVVAFKKLGADDTFLKKIITRHDKIQSVCKKFDIDKVFKPKAKPKKSTTTKVTKVTKIEDVIPEDDDPAEPNEDEEEEEFEGMDIEENEEDEDQLVDEEEFIEDMDDD